MLMCMFFVYSSPAASIAHETDRQACVASVSKGERERAVSRSASSWTLSRSLVPSTATFALPSQRHRVPTLLPPTNPPASQPLRLASVHAQLPPPDDPCFYFSCPPLHLVKLLRVRSPLVRRHFPSQDRRRPSCFARRRAALLHASGETPATLRPTRWVWHSWPRLLVRESAKEA